MNPVYQKQVPFMEVVPSLKLIDFFIIYLGENMYDKKKPSVCLFKCFAASSEL